MTHPLQKSDDKHFFDQPGSGAGMPETLIEQDSPKNILEVNTGNAKESSIEPKNAGTRDGYYDKITDKDKNLREQFVDKGASDA